MMIRRLHCGCTHGRTCRARISATKPCCISSALRVVINVQRRMDTERDEDCVTTWWYVVGPLGAVQYMSIHVRRVNLHIPVDLGIHKPAVAEVSMPNCKLLGGPCHFIPGFKGATEIYERYRQDGEFEGIWRALEETYRTTFDG